MRWSCPPGRRWSPMPSWLMLLRGLEPRGCQGKLDAWLPWKSLLRPLVVCPSDEQPERPDRRSGCPDVLVNVTRPCDGDRLGRLLVELVAVKPRRLIVLRPNPPHAEFIISAAHGLEVQP